MQVGASLCGGWGYAYLCEFFRQVCREIGGISLDENQVFLRMAVLAREKTASTLRVNPRFAGTRDGDNEASGSITDIGVDNFLPAELIHAFREGIVRELAELAGMGRTGLADRLPWRLVATGNAMRRNPEMLAICEKIFKLPCQLSPHMEEAGAGAALWLLDNLAGRQT